MMLRPHYAWTICLGGALSLLAVMGLGVNVFTVYQPYIIDLNGFTNAKGSMITTVRSFFVLFAMLSVNRVCARLGIRRVMTLGVLLLAVSCGAFALAERFETYCIAAALSGIAYSYGGMVPLTLVISRWFRDRKNFALGLASAGSGVSTIIAPSILTWIIEHHSMQAAFLAEGGCVLLVAFLVWRLVRGAPENVGMSPYQTTAGESRKADSAPVSPGTGKSLWWALFCAAFLYGTAAGPGFSHLTVLFTGAGYDSMLVAWLMSLLGFMLIVGKIMGGQLYDMLGGWWGNFYMFGVFMSGLVLSWLTPLGGGVLPVLTVVLLGLGFSLIGIQFPVWARDLVGGEGYEHTVQSLNVACSLGTLVAGPIPGMLADRFGGYVPAYIMFFIVLAMSMAIVQCTYIRRGVGKYPADRSC